MKRNLCFQNQEAELEEELRDKRKLLNIHLVKMMIRVF